MNKYQTMDEFYKACGDAIRAKKNNAEQVERINIPEEILSIPTNEALVVDSLDESLLTEENVGKVYECKGKLYRIIFENPFIKNSYYDEFGNHMTSVTIEVPAGWSVPAGYGYFRYYNQSESNVYNLYMGFSDVLSNYADNCIYIIDDNGNEVGIFTPENSLRFEIIEHHLMTDDGITLAIQWLIDNGATFNGKTPYEFKEIYEGKPKEYFLTFSSETPFSLQFGGYNSADESPTLEYSTDKTNWRVWDMPNEGLSEIINSSSDGKLYMRGIGNATMYNGVFYNVSPTNGTALDDFRFDCTGNIETLLDYQTVMSGNHPLMDSGCFAGLFGDTNIVNPPELPAMQLTESCYQVMFYNCKYLEKAPELPSPFVMRYSYYAMFEGCVRLAIAPKLPAKLLNKQCYGNMFKDCINLTSISELPATVLAEGCYFLMFDGCKNIKLETENNISAYRVPKSGDAIVNDISGYKTMFSNTGGSIKQINLNTTYYTSNIVK